MDHLQRSMVLPIVSQGKDRRPIRRKGEMSRERGSVVTGEALLVSGNFQGLKSSLLAVSTG